VKDFVGLITNRQSAHRKKSARFQPSSSGFSRLLLGAAGLVLLAVFSVMMIRSLRWADFFSQSGQQTVLFTTKQVDQVGSYLVTFYFNELRTEIFPIKPEVSTEVIGGYGTYRFQAVYPLLVLEGKDLSYIRSTMSLSMGVLLDELWTANQADLDLASAGQLQRFLMTHFWQNWQIPLVQKASWLALLLDQRTEVTVRQPVTALPANEFLDREFTQSEPLCTVALVNTTSMNGLAGRIADLLEGHNFRVVRTISDNDTVERSKVLTDEELSADCQLVLDRVERLVPGEIEREKNHQEIVRNRADLVVKLGTDLSQQP
jgi:hypothetical protein